MSFSFSVPTPSLRGALSGLKISMDNTLNPVFGDHEDTEKSLLTYSLSFVVDVHVIFNGKIIPSSDIRITDSFRRYCLCVFQDKVVLINFSYMRIENMVNACDLGGLQLFATKYVIFSTVTARQSSRGYPRTCIPESKNAKHDVSY